jgi:iron complex outermembrane recepter protein
VVQPLQPYAPETAWTYEAGLRADLFSHHLRGSATVFRTRWDDIQASSFDTAQNLVLVQNPGSARLQGVELEAVAVPTTHLLLRANIGYIDARYVSLAAGARGVSLSDPLVKTPRLTYAAGLTLALPGRGAGQWVGDLNWSWRDQQSTASTSSNTVLLPAFGLLNGRLQFRPARSRWTVALVANNLLGKVYYIGGIDFAAEGSIGMKQLDLGRPREIGLDARLSF